MNVLAEVPLFAETHGNVALVTVISASGSTPRHPGAHMLVSAAGQQCGSIGGGRVEQEVVESARAVAAGGPPELVRHNLVKDLAMCCGGSMELFIEPLTACAEIITTVKGRQRQRQVSVLETDLEHGGKRLADLEHASETPFREGSVFRETVWPAPRVVLFGCGHLARAIGPLARSLEFDVIVCDDNATGAVESDPDWANEVVSSFALADVDKKLRLGRRDYLLILTRDHGIDQRILEESLLRVDDVDYLGLIGSLGKVGRFRKRVLAKGKVSEEQWSKLHAPIGLDICAETPQEIAVSIMAELVALKNRGTRP